MRRWLLTLWMVAVLALAARPALADDSAATFQAAKKLYEAKSYDKALPLFQDAYAQSKSPNAHVYVARCLRELGRKAEAYDEMAVTVREATALAASDAKYEPTRDSAAAELALLEPQVGRVVIAIPDEAGLEVLVNGKLLDPKKRSDVVAVIPGTVAIEARAPGKDTVRRDETVGAGQLKTVTLAFAAKSDGKQDDGAPAPAAPAETDSNLIKSSKGLEGLRLHLGVVVLGGPHFYFPSDDERSWGAENSIAGSFLFAISGGILVDRFDLRLEISPATWMPNATVLDAPAFQTNLTGGYHIQLTGPLNYVMRGGVGLALNVTGGPTNFVGRADVVGLSALAGPVLIEINAPSFRAVTDFKALALDPFFGTQLSLMLDDL